MDTWLCRDKNYYFLTTRKPCKYKGNSFYDYKNRKINEYMKTFKETLKFENKHGIVMAIGKYVEVTVVYHMSGIRIFVI